MCKFIVINNDKEKYYTSCKEQDGHLAGRIPASVTLGAQIWGPISCWSTVPEKRQMTNQKSYYNLNVTRSHVLQLLFYIDQLSADCIMYQLN